MRVSLVLVLVLAPLLVFAQEHPQEPPEPPTAVIDQPSYYGFVYEGFPGQEIEFSAAGSFAEGDKSIDSFHWDFGDGFETTEFFYPFTSHEYFEPGEHQLQLFVIDDESEQSNTATAPVFIGPSKPQLVSPEDEAEFVELRENPDTGKLEVLLQWEPPQLGEVHEYRYQVWKKGDQPQEPESAGTDLSVFVPDLERLETFEWRVFACTDTDRNGPIDQLLECNPSETWSFDYSLPPPENLTSESTAERVFLDWEDIPHAKSYELIVSNCPPWFWNEADGECETLSTYQVIFEPCPDEFWNEELGECETAQEYEVQNLSEYEESQTKEGACFFQREESYDWRVASCFDEKSRECGPASSSEDNFRTSGAHNRTLPAPTNLFPKETEENGIPIVNPETSLKWKGDDNCAYKFLVLLTRESDGRVFDYHTPNFHETFFSLAFKEPIYEEWMQEIELKETKEDAEHREEMRKFWSDPQNLDATFEWTVTPCWLEPANDWWIFTISREEPRCDPDGDSTTASQPAKFRTTGAAPTELIQEASSLPVRVSWNDTGGTSYRYEIQGGDTFIEGVSQENFATIGVADGLRPGRAYSWTVSTCVNPEGTMCGGESEPSLLSVDPLLPPETLLLSEEGTVELTDSIRWSRGSGAAGYRYRLEYVRKSETERSSRCPNQQVFADQVSADPEAPFPIYCMGDYRILVQSCLHEDCSCEDENSCQDWEISDWSNEGRPWTLTAVQPAAAPIVGLVPCGRQTDILSSPHVETDPCELKHLGILFQLIFDFVVWRFSFLVLGILVVVSAGTMFFAADKPEQIGRIRQWFKAFFLGFAIALAAWLIVNTVMVIFGFQAGFFGSWFEIPL